MKDIEKLDAETLLAKTAMVFESIPAGLLLFDSDGVLKACNRRLCSLLGFQIQDMYGRTATEVFASKKSNRELMEFFTNSGGNKLCECSINTAISGQLLPVKVIPSKIELANSSHLVLLVIDSSLESIRLD